MRYKNKIQTGFIIVVAIAIAATVPGIIWAQNLNSPNYRVEDSEFNSGGEAANSATYRSSDTIGSPDSDNANSATYGGFWGFLRIAHPGIPGQPTLTNTGGNLYSSLDFVISTGDNPSDANYAVAMSPDDFTTTYYIQADDTIGTDPVWRSYIAWGSGTGQRVTGLAPNTTYKIKVKARFGTNTETGFSVTATAATTGQTISFSISGVPLSTTIAGETTTIGTSANAMSFSTLPVGSAAVAAQQVTVSTNASGGYTTTLFQDGNLRKGNGDQIQPVASSNDSPASWPGTVTTGAFGYHATDASLCTGTATRFSTDNTYAAATTTPLEVACSAGPVTNETTSLVYKLQIGSLQQSGTYSNIITYITTAVY